MLIAPTSPRSFVVAPLVGVIFLLLLLRVRLQALFNRREALFERREARAELLDFGGLLLQLGGAYFQRLDRREAHPGEVLDAG